MSLSYCEVFGIHRMQSIYIQKNVITDELCHNGPYSDIWQLEKTSLNRVFEDAVYGLWYKF